jgi:hypothetical protein
MELNGSNSRSMSRRAAATGLVIIAAVALAVSAQPASAASHRPCTVVKHSNTNGVTKVGGATASVGTDGVKLTTSQSTNVDKVSWQTSFKPVLASTVNEVTYETTKLDATAGNNNVVNDSAVPAYHIYVKTPKGEGVLVFEPYWYLSKIGGGNPQRNVRTEWDVLAGPLWTSSDNITDLPKTAGGPATLTFAQVVAANPKMTVTGIGFGLGTYNAGVISVLDEQRFATTRSCSEHQWSTGFKNGGWWPGWLH